MPTYLRSDAYIPIKLYKHLRDISNLSETSIVTSNYNLIFLTIKFEKIH